MSRRAGADLYPTKLKAQHQFTDALYLSPVCYVRHRLLSSRTSMARQTQLPYNLRQRTSNETSFHAGHRSIAISQSRR